MEEVSIIPQNNLTENMKNWTDRFPGLSRLDQGLKGRIETNSNIISFKKNSLVFGPDKSPENMFFLISGTVRVQQVSATGREIVLYRIEAGQTCVLTISCLLSFDQYSAEGRADTDLISAYISRDLFDELVASSKPFRNLVFAAFSKRITDLFLVIDEVAFQRIDLRLARKLIEIAKKSDVLEVTHQALAIELGTAREVISRQLKEFQRREWISQSRGKMKILNASQLIKLASQKLIE